MLCNNLASKNLTISPCQMQYFYQGLDPSASAATTACLGIWAC